MAKANKAQSIEAQLVEDDAPTINVVDPIFALDGSADLSYLSSDDEDFRGRNKVAKVLEGDEAMAFLGLPKGRPFCHLKRGDRGRIAEKYGKLLERLRKTGDEALFWDAITIRVWNKKNIEGYTADRIKGKQTGASPSNGIKSMEYVGELMPGGRIEDFLSEVRNSTKWREYILQIVSVQVTEEMASYG